MPREGSDLRPAADRHRRVHQPGDRRDPRAVRVHGRFPVDDRARHVHHQRHRARRRHAAGPFPRRLRDGAEGSREAGLHREPDAGARLVARARDRQEGPRLRPHRPQAQAAGHRAAARDGLRVRRGDPQPVRQLALHPPDARRGPRDGPQRGGLADRAVQEAAPGRAAVGRRRALAAEPAVLRPQALRPHARGPLQAELAPGPRHRPRDPHADPRRHHRPGPRAGLAAAAARHARGQRRRGQGLRGRGAVDAARADPGSPRRVRALRQPPAAHRRRADPGGVPDRPVPDGARRARAPHHRGRRHDHAADDRQHPPGRGGAEGVLRLLPAQPVHGPDELPRRPPAPPQAVRARRRWSHARARADRGARRAPDPLRPHVPDRDPGRPEHRPDRLAVLLRRDLRARVRHDPVPGRQERQRHRRDRPPRRHPGGGADHRPGEHAGRRQGQADRATRSSAGPRRAST